MRNRLQSLWSLAGCVGLLAACATQQPTPPPAEPAASSAATPGAAPAASAPSTATATSSTATPVPVVVTPDMQQSAQRQATAAIALLEAGEEEKASAQLQRALALDPSNKLAQSLARQIQVDPLAALGREYFMYRVQPGESLSKIADRFLGDVHLFYILARYNDLRVPRQLNAGQMVKVPGKAPAAAPPAAAVAAPATPALPVATPAAPAASQAPAPAAATPAAQAPDPAKAEKDKAARIAAATKAARSAFARQDLVNAIKNWDLVLELDPENNTAKVERQRAVELKAKLDKLK